MSTVIPKKVHAQSTVKEENSSQIGQYVTSIFEDSKGHLWFGTLEKGIAKYDGNNFGLVGLVLMQDLL